MDQRKIESLLRVGRVIRHLFHQLRALAETVEPPVPGFTAAHRAVLESLFTRGPDTVPALARARPVARQFIQVLVNDLLEMGFVETQPNPAHKRSPLVALTDSGGRCFEEIRRAENDVLRNAKLPLSREALDRAATDLETLSDSLGAILASRSGGAE